MKTKPPAILAIDTSCDDTAVAVTVGHIVHSNVIASQAEIHKKFGGVFPTLAKKAHRQNLEPTVSLALRQAGHDWTTIDALAVTQGPGLAPALEIGIDYARLKAQDHQLPLITVNHLEGHLWSVLGKPKPRKRRNTSNTNGHQTNNRQTMTAKTTQTAQAHQTIQDTQTTQVTQELLENVEYPVLGLVISGGHSLFVLIKNVGQYHVVGQSLDDAAGECLDKIGRMLNLGYPAGPVIEEFAKKGNRRRYQFPLPLTRSKNYHLSFSGLKTFARNLIEDKGGVKTLGKQDIYDFCASTQYAVFRHICYKMNKILEQHQVAEIWVGGGVATNITLRRMIRKTIRNFIRKQKAKNAPANPKKAKLQAPYSKRLCVDNAAMIGVVAGIKWQIAGKQAFSQNPDLVDRQPRMKLAELG